MKQLPLPRLLFDTSDRLALVAATAVLLAGCGSDQASGIKPVTRLPDMAAPETVTVATAANQASGEQVRKMETHGSIHATARLSATGSTALSTTTAASAAATSSSISQIQGIPAPPRTTIQQGGNVLAVAGVAFTVAPDWKVVTPSSKLRAAQYAIPGPGGDAEIAVFFFGPGQGGNVDQNVRRWIGQFTPDANTTGPLAGEVGTLESGDLKITLVRTQGTYNPGSMGVGDPTPQPNAALFGLVVEGGPEGNVFVKVTGPRATMEKQRQALEEFAQTTRKSNYR